MPIRKGDGTGLAPKGIAEARKGDGTVLYSAGSPVIDSFENGTVTDYYGYDTAEFDINSGPAAGPVDGSLVLEHIDTGYDRIVSTSGLANYPAPGDTFRFYFNSTQSSVQVAMMFGVQDSSAGDAYAVRYEPNQDDIVIQRRDGGSVASTLDANYSVGTPYAVGEWWHVEIDWATDGTITATLRDNSDTDIVTLSGTDTTYGAGGVCWRGYQGGSAGGIYFDYAHLL